jgi:hypothetical protein
MKAPVFVSVVLYTADEGADAGFFVTELAGAVAGLFESAEIVVVDDASSDATVEYVENAAAASTVPVTVVRLARRTGVEAAMVAGLQRAMGDFVFELETCHPDFGLDLLDVLYRRAAHGTDIVAASDGTTSLGSRAFYRLVNRYGNLGVPLATERVRVVSRRALNAMLALRETVRYRKALYAVTGYAYERVTYTPVRKRASGGSRRGHRSPATALEVLIAFSTFGEHAVFSLAVAFGVFSLLGAAYAATVYLLHGAVSGWTTMMLAVSLGFAGLFFVLGVLGTTIGTILEEVCGRPQFAVRSVRVHNPLSAGRTDQGVRTSGSVFEGQLAEAIGLTEGRGDRVPPTPAPAADERCPSGR